MVQVDGFVAITSWWHDMKQLVMIVVTDVQPRISQSLQCQANKVPFMIAQFGPKAIN